jgi:putative membrane protein
MEHRSVITTLSVLIPLLVAVLFSIEPIPGYNTRFLPPVYASINGLTAVLLITAWWAIRNGRRRLHERIMKTCIALSASFLVMYVLYHMTNPSTPFGGQGWIRPVYFFLLLTHIMLSVAVVPLVLVSLSRALSARFDRHRKLARFALPLWLYVAVSGVLVYLMIAPYYPS